MLSTTGIGVFYFRRFAANGRDADDNAARLSLGTETRITVNYNPTAVDIVRNHDSVPRAAGSPQVALDLTYEIESCQLDPRMWQLITTGRISNDREAVETTGTVSTGEFDFRTTANGGTDQTIDSNRWYQWRGWPWSAVRIVGDRGAYGLNNTANDLAINHDYEAKLSLGLFRFLPTLGGNPLRVNEEGTNRPDTVRDRFLVYPTAHSSAHSLMLWPVSDYEAERGIGDLYIYDDRETVVWAHKNFPCTIFCSSDVTFNPTEVAKPTITVAPHVNHNANPALGQLFVADRYATN